MTINPGPRHRNHHRPGALGRLAAAVAAVAGVWAIAGCGDAGLGTSTGVVVDGTYLSADTSTFTLVPDTQVSVTVDGSTLGASAGCNSLSATWRADGDRLVVDEVASTMIGCAPELQDQDERLAALLTSQPTVAASTNGFTLTADDGTTLVLVDRRVADPDLPVTGTLWQLTTVITSDTATTAAGFDTVSMRLDDGTLTITTACATGSTTYSQVGGDIFDVAPLTLTTTTSPGDGECTDGVIEAQQAVVAVLNGTVTATVEARTLTVRGGELALGFVAA